MKKHLLIKLYILTVMVLEYLDELEESKWYQKGVKFTAKRFKKELEAWIGVMLVPTGKQLNDFVSEITTSLNTQLSVLDAVEDEKEEKTKI